MAKNNKTIDRIQAVWNILGGEDGVDKLLRGELMVSSAVLPSQTVWKTITLATYKDLRSLEAALRLAHCKMNDYVRKLLNMSVFRLLPVRVKFDLVVRSVAELGFEEPATYPQICDRALELGLSLCLAEVGPALRLAYLDQPPDEYLRIAMCPIVDMGNCRIFSVNHEFDGLKLAWTGGNADTVWKLSERLVFTLLRK